MATPTTVPVQQPQVSTYNHPCGDLLDGGRRRDYLKFGVPLYTASIEGDLKAAKVILKGREHLVRYSVTENLETPLHIAATRHSTEFVRYLVNMMSRVDLELQNEDGNTAFCLAAISGNVGMAKIMVEKNQALPIICGRENMTPLYLAAYHGRRDMVIFLYDQSDRMMGNGWTDDSRNGVLVKCIQAKIFDVALRILEDNEELPPREHLWDMLQALAQMHWAFYENRPRTSNPQRNLYLVLFHWVTRRGLKESNATPVLRLIWKRIMEKPKDVIDEILRGPMIKKDETETYPSQILFVAAKWNNAQFLVELVRGYRDILWKRNDDGQTIFHIAVSHRYHDIYSLLYEIGSMKDLIAPIRDHDGNNILHLAGKSPEKTAYAYWVTSSLQMHSEFLWYSEVRRILPPPCRDVMNAASQTPSELFLENHKDIALGCMKSINDTVNVSMVVAALVFTLGFSVVFQIPGGFDQSNGLPVFLHHNYFIAFVVLVSISFILSTTSIFCFIAVYVSYQHRNMRPVLRRWLTGQLFLLSSVFFLVLAFCLSFFIQYLKGTSAYIIHPLVYLFTILYTSVCLSGVLKSIKSPYGISFRLEKHRLYRKDD